jgi:superfamily I DNA/RNA helicase
MCSSIAASITEYGLSFGDVLYHPLPEGAFRGRALKALNRARDVFNQLSVWDAEDLLTERTCDISNILESHIGSAAREAWTEVVAPLPSGTTLREGRDWLWADTIEQREQVLTDICNRLGCAPPATSDLPQRVQVMTMHGAKGLSGHVVFIPALEEEILPGPHRRPYPGLILEAARLLYVSVSRARAACVLSYAKGRVLNGKYSSHTPSRFTSCLGGRFCTNTGGGLSDSEVAEIAAFCSQL